MKPKLTPLLLTILILTLIIPGWWRSGRAGEAAVPLAPEWNTSLVSVASDGTKANIGAWTTSISADGRYVVISTEAGNLVEGDTNQIADVFVHDRISGYTTRVSVASDGTQGDRPSSDAVLSADGRFVAFDSIATNLVSNDTNQVKDVFVHDRQSGETRRVSVSSDGSQATHDCSNPSMSGDGRYVVFESRSANLVADDADWVEDIFVHDLATGQTRQITKAFDGSQANAFSAEAEISADGRFVAFEFDGQQPGDR